MTKPRVAVVGIPGKASTEALRTAFESLTGACRLLDCRSLSLDSDGVTVRAGGEPVGDLDLLVIKKLGARYSPIMLDRLEILRCLEDRGVRVHPSPDALRVLLNRATGTLHLLRAGIPMPETLITESPEEIVAKLDDWGAGVLKPLYSTKARGMVVIKRGKKALDAVRSFQDKGHQLIYAQRQVEFPGRDLGVVFIGGNYVGTYARVSGGSWNTTTRSGGHYENHDSSPAVLELADRARKVFGLTFSSIDVAETPEGPIVFEVSAFGGFRGLREACDLNAAQLFAEHLLEPR